MTRRHRRVISRTRFSVSSKKHLPKAKKNATINRYVSVAQLDRAQASDAWCRWFESNRVHQKKTPLRVSFLMSLVGRTDAGSREERSDDTLPRVPPWEAAIYNRVHQNLTSFIQAERLGMVSLHSSALIEYARIPIHRLNILFIRLSLRNRHNIDTKNIAIMAFLLQDGFALL